MAADPLDRSHLIARTASQDERMLWLRTLFLFGGPAMILLLIAEGYQAYVGRIKPGVFLLLALLDLPAVWLMSRLIFRLIEAGATGLVSMAYAAGNLPREPGFSSEESLIARGFYLDAAEALRRRADHDPSGVEARIRLAELQRVQLGDQESAERTYLETRRLPMRPSEELRISNGLIELYRGAGRTDRMKVELARFAERYRGTHAGAEAARALRELKDPPR
jgi:hypothetical protein